MPDPAVNQEDGGFTVSGRFLNFLFLGVALVFVGFAIVVVASLFLGGGSSSVGGVIFIGPIPIVFGSGPDATWLVLIGVVLAALSVVAFWVMNRRYRRFSEEQEEFTG